MTKGWLKSMPPESLKPQGAGPARTTFWGMIFLSQRSFLQRASPRSETVSWPRTAAGPEFYSRSPLTSQVSPCPRLLPPRRAPTLEERAAPAPREWAALREELRVTLPSLPFSHTCPRARPSARPSVCPLGAGSNLVCRGKERSNNSFHKSKPTHPDKELLNYFKGVYVYIRARWPGLKWHRALKPQFPLL